MTDPVLAFIRLHGPAHYSAIMNGLNLTTMQLHPKINALLAVGQITERHDPNTGSYFTVTETKPTQEYGKQTSI